MKIAKKLTLKELIAEMRAELTPEEKKAIDKVKKKNVKVKK